MAKAKMVTMSKPGKKPIKFHEGGLHRSLKVPNGKKIPPGKMAGALKGEYGETAQRQAQFKKNVLTGKKKK